VALDFTVLDAPFSGGLDLKTAKKQVGPGKLLKCQNGIWVKRNKIDKANGSVAIIENTSALTAPGMLATFDDELIVGGTGTTLGQTTQYSLAQSANEFVQKGSHQPIYVGAQQLVANIYDHSAVDAATTNGITVYAYESNGGLRGTIVDQTEGTLLVSDAVIDASGVDARVVAIGAQLVVFYRVVGTGLKASIVAAGSPSFGSPVSVITASQTSANPTYEARAVTAVPVPYIAIAYADSGANSLYIMGWNPLTQATQIAAQTVETGTTPQTVGMWVCAANILVGWTASGASSAAIKYAWYSLQEVLTTATQTLATTSIGWGNITFKQVTNADGYFLWEEGGPNTATTTSAPTIWQALMGINGTRLDTAAIVRRGVSLLGDAWLPAGYGLPYVPIAYSSQVQPTDFLMDVTGQITAKIQPMTAGGASTRFRLCTVSSTLSGNTIFPVLTTTQATGSFNAIYSTVRAVSTCILNLAVTQAAAQLGENLHLTGGFLAAYDAVQFVEHIFHIYPEQPNVLGSPVAVYRVQAGVAGAPGVAKSEITQITFPPPRWNALQTIYGSGWQIQPGSYFTLVAQSDNTHTNGQSNWYYVWFAVDGVGTDPALSLTAGIKISIKSTDLDTEICNKVALAIGYTPTTPPVTIQNYFICQVLGAPIAGGNAEPQPGAVSLYVVAFTGTMTSNAGYPSAWSDLMVFGNLATGAIGGGPIDNTLIGTGDGSTYVFYAGTPPPQPPPNIGTIALVTPVFPFSVVVNQQGGGSGQTQGTAGVDNGNGQISGPNLVGYIDYSNGNMQLTFDNPPQAGTQITVNYDVSPSGTGNTESIFICPAGNRIMPGGYIVVPFQAAQGNGDTAAIFWFEVDGVGAAPTNPTLGPLICLNDIFTVSIASTATPIAVATALNNEVTAALTAVGGTTAFTQKTQPSDISVLLSWTTQGTSYLGGYNVNASGQLVEANSGYGTGTSTITVYEATYEDYDGRGQVVRSAPSVPAYCIYNGTLQQYIFNAQNIPGGGGPVILVGGCLPRLSVNTLRVTAKSNVGIVIYRTVQNPPFSSSGALNPIDLYRVSATATQANGIPPGPLLNSETVDIYNQGNATYAAAWALGCSFFDTLLDGQIQANEVLYTGGGELANFASPAMGFVAQHRGRLFTTLTEQPNSIWFSQTFEPGAQITPGFNPELTIPIDPAGGVLNALASMDEKLIIFETGQIFYIQGDGPDATGTDQGSQYFTPPDLITTDCGCIAPGSVVVVPAGIMFQSAKGIYLLSRGLVLDYTIGEQVEDLVQGNTVLSATLMPDRQEVRFALNNGTTLFYNYLFGTWSERLNWGGPGIIFGGKYTFQKANGQPVQEAPGIYTDSGQPYSLLVQTAWLKPNGLQGEFRLSQMSLLGDFHSNHILLCQVAIDYETRPCMPPIIWNPGPVINANQFGGGIFGQVSPFGGGLEGNSYQFRAFIEREIEAVQFTLSDTYTQAPYSGMSIENLSIEVGLEKGIKRFGPGKTV
jgi:hypothetical protein